MCVHMYLCVCVHVCMYVCYRKVLQSGLQSFEVEVYLWEYKFCTHANQSEVVTEEFSRACTVGEL